MDLMEYLLLLAGFYIVFRLLKFIFYYNLQSVAHTHHIPVTVEKVMTGHKQYFAYLGKNNSFLGQANTEDEIFSIIQNKFTVHDTITVTIVEVEK